MSKQSTPLITIIIPVHNEECFIRKSLWAVLDQDYPLDHIQILVVDGRSTDDTRQCVKEIAEHLPERSIQILDNPGRIVPNGLNVGLQQSLGDMIIRVDGHTTIATNYVRQCVDALQRTGAWNVGGKMNARGTTYFGKVVALATSTPFGIGGGRFHYSDREEWVDTVYMGAWPRWVFKRIGLFDEELIRDQDDEFNYRIRKAGGKIFLSPKINSEYTVRGSPKALWEQYFQYSFWKVRVLQKHPRQMSLRQFVPPAFVLSLLVSILLAIFSTSRSLSIFVPMLYLMANLLASLVTASKRGWKYLPLLLLTFAILHLSYGFGFLIGLIKFWNRWDDKVGKVPDFSNEPAG